MSLPIRSFAIKHLLYPNSRPKSVHTSGSNLSTVQTNNANNSSSKQVNDIVITEPIGYYPNSTRIMACGCIGPIENKSFPNRMGLNLTLVIWVSDVSATSKTTYAQVPVLPGSN